jgi:transcriptional regulator with XRE-family HTH domain
MSNLFTEKLKVFMITKKKDISQKDLAKEVGVSAAALSNIMTGKKSPPVEFLIKCKEYFDLSDEETVDFFISAFSFSDTITLDAAIYLNDNRRKLLGIIITTLLLLPETSQNPNDQKNLDAFKRSIERNINTCYNELVSVKEITHLEISNQKDSKAEDTAGNGIF